MNKNTFQAFFNNDLNKAKQFEAASNAQYLSEVPSWEVTEFMMDFEPKTDWESLYEAHGKDYVLKDLKNFVESFVECQYLPESFLNN